MKTNHVLIIAAAIILSTIIYCFSNRYYLSQPRSRWNTTYVMDRWTGTAVIQNEAPKSFRTTTKPRKQSEEDDE